MKHYKSVFLSNFGMSSPPAQRKPPIVDFLAMIQNETRAV